MNSDVTIWEDGKPRCGWVRAGDTALAHYHDETWGTRTYDESALFEALTLGVFEVGLSWAVVFGKRDAFREAFRGFDAAKVAAMTERDVDRLVTDASIIRNRGKIQATVDNARAMQSASPSLGELAKSYAVDRKHSLRSADLPSSTPEAEAFAKQLKSQGVSLRRAHERVRVHAERRGRQRPRPRLLSRDRLREELTLTRSPSSSRVGARPASHPS